MQINQDACFLGQQADGRKNTGTGKAPHPALCGLSPESKEGSEQGEGESAVSAWRGSHGDKAGLCPQGHGEVSEQRINKLTPNSWALAFQGLFWSA